MTTEQARPAGEEAESQGKKVGIAYFCFSVYSNVYVLYIYIYIHTKLCINVTMLAAVGFTIVPPL